MLGVRRVCAAGFEVCTSAKPAASCTFGILTFKLKVKSPQPLKPRKAFVSLKELWSVSRCLAYCRKLIPMLTRLGVKNSPTDMFQNFQPFW